MPRRVLVTRPEPGASQTAGRLRALGCEPVVLPLTELVARSPDVLGDPEAEAVAVSSANALRLAPPELIARLRALPCHAVGGATAAAARTAGIEAVTEAGGDAAALAEQLCQGFPPGTRIAYLCGRVRTPVLEEQLAGCGLVVHALETYDTRKVSYSTNSLRRIVGSSAVDAALVHSVAGAKALAELIREPELAHQTEKTVFFCLSKRIGQVFSGYPDARIAVSDMPTETALLNLLGRSL